LPQDSDRLSQRNCLNLRAKIYGAVKRQKSLWRTAEAEKTRKAADIRFGSSADIL